MQGNNNMTLVRFPDSGELDKAIEILSKEPSWIVSPHPDNLILDLPRNLLLRIYQKEIKFEIYVDDDD